MKTKTFHTFESGFLKQNNILKMLIIVLISLVVILGYIAGGMRTFFLVQNKDTFRTEITVAEICHEAFSTINNGVINSALLSEKLVNGIKHVGFTLNAERIFPPLVFEEDKICKIVIRDKRGLRAFEAAVDKSSSHPLGVKLDDITEVHISQQLERYK